MSSGVAKIVKPATKILGTATGALGGIGGQVAGGFLGPSFVPEKVPISEEAFRQKISEAGRVGEVGGQQAELTSALQARARGEGPSVAEKTARAEAERGIAERRAAGAGTRGRGGALAARTQARLASQTQQKLAQQVGILRAQEQLSSQQLLAQQLAQQRSQEISVAEADRSSLQALENLRVQQALGTAGIAGQAAAERQKAVGGLIGGLGGGAVAALSDKNLKVNIKDGKNATKDFLDALSSKTFDFKDQSLGEGKQLGILAQDVEKAGEIGKGLVIETPIGKAIDTARGFGTILAAQADLNKRLSEIESKKSKTKVRDRKKKEKA